MSKGLFTLSREKRVVFIFFFIFLVLGLTIAKDYGVHWDEYNNQNLGARWYHYAGNVILHGAPLDPIADESREDIIHGPAIEMFLAFLTETVFGWTDSREIIIFRHYCTWVLFYISVVFFYFLCKLHFNSAKTALLGCLMLVLHPRIFAHSFYDSIDIAHLSFYVISLFTLSLYLKTRTARMAVIHAFACAVLMDIRSIGIVIPLISYVVFLWDMVKRRQDGKFPAGHWRHLFVFSVLFCFFMVLLWPYLWWNPLLGLMEVVRQTPRISFVTVTLYLGGYIEGMKLPWHYLPLWILISTPLLYSVFFIAGCFLFVKKILDEKLFGFCTETKNEFIFLSAFFVPFLLVILMRSTLYDSWRHMFFIYPAFVLVALTGVTGCRNLIVKYMNGKLVRFVNTAFAALFIMSFSFTAFFMITNHPHQMVYFNCLFGSNMEKAKANFDLEYWGLSYRQALEYILEHDKSGNIKVYDAVNDLPTTVNIRILPVQSRNRICRTDNPQEAKYILTNYRWHEKDYTYRNEFYSIRIGNARMMSVFKMGDE